MPASIAGALMAADMLASTYNLPGDDIVHAPFRETAMVYVFLDIC